MNVNSGSLFRFVQALPRWAAALWWGSLTTIGFLVVPLLFAHLPGSMAGALAAKLFAAQTWVSVACTSLLLLASRPKEGEEGGDPLHAARLLVVGGLLLALLVEFAVAPRIVARENLAIWHRIGSAMYFTQWVCAALTFWRLGKRQV
ncbi:MAG: DUF4149 domain-containing protein [Hylemonella sp.]|nr:DUF4149 domain-containing protein [Hylemonella sp.]